MPDDTTPMPMTQMKPRHKPNADEIGEMLAEMQQCLDEAAAIGFLERMEHNHDVRQAYWEGQSLDGRKWSVPNNRRTRPGEQPQPVFPWEGAADNRKRLVDMVIREHNDFKILALQRRQGRVGPRNLSPDKEPQAAAALWGQTADYYDDIGRRDFRTASAQWSDIAEEYGHGVLFVGWKAELEVVARTMSAEQVAEAISKAALELQAEALKQDHLANGGGEEDAPQLEAEEIVMIQQDAFARLEMLMLDDTQRAVFAAQLMALDEQMPKDEAMRLARELKKGQPVRYFAVDEVNPQPEYRACTPFIDICYRATTSRLKNASRIFLSEWVTSAELRARTRTARPYTEAWVNKVLQIPGQSCKQSKFAWAMTNGNVRRKIEEQSTTGQKVDLFQIIHCYYRASAIGNVPALYHTVIHPGVADDFGYHECCEHAHGRYPVFETMTDIYAPYLLASEGVGEKSATEQSTIKIHADLQDDCASIAINPPMKIPMNADKPAIRPNSTIRMRGATAGMGVMEALKIGADAEGSQFVVQMTLDSFNEYWARGPKVDPEVKIAARQTLVSNFLTDVEAAKEQAFQLIQEFAPDELRASFIGGLPVNMAVSKKDIQGQVAIEYDFDVGELDSSTMQMRLKAIPTLLQFNNRALLKDDGMLRAMTSWLLPSHYKLLVANPENQLKDEIEDEDNINTRILSGTLMSEEASYVPGTNHEARLEWMSQLYGVAVDKKGEIVRSFPMGPDGQPKRSQRIFAEDPEVQALVMNRLRFHARQIQQMQENALTGKRLVEPVADEAA